MMNLRIFNRKEVKEMSCKCGCGTGHTRHHNRCGCGGHTGFRRRFATREEQVKELESYLEDLNNEVKAVKEQIAELKK